MASLLTYAANSSQQSPPDSVIAFLPEQPQGCQPDSTPQRVKKG